MQLDQSSAVSIIYYIAEGYFNQEAAIAKQRQNVNCEFYIQKDYECLLTFLLYFTVINLLTPFHNDCDFLFWLNRCWSFKGPVEWHFFLQFVRFSCLEKIWTLLKVWLVRTKEDTRLMDSISILHVSFSVKETNHLMAREVTPYQNNDPAGFLIFIC